MTKSGTLKKDLTSGNIFLLLLSFFGPIFFANILQTVYNIADMAIVGHFVGKEGLSAVSACGDINNVLTFAAFGFSTAGQVIISRNIGSGDNEAAGITMGNLISSLLVISALLSVLSVIFCEQILNAVNIPQEAYAYAMDYLIIISCGLVFSYGYNAVGAIFRGLGDSFHPFLFVAIASVLNIILDIIFVAGFKMAVFGAALATVISQAASLLFSIWFIITHREKLPFRLSPAIFRPDRGTIIKIFKLGIPMALQSGLIQFSKLVVLSWINAYGVAVSSITGIGNKFNSIGLTFCGALGSASASMTSQCIGAGKHDRVKKTMLCTMALSITICTVITGIIFLFPRLIFSVFTNDSEVLDLMWGYLPVIAVMLYSSAFRCPMNGLINGSGKSFMNFALAILDGVVGHIGLAALLAFGFNLGIKGLWYGNAAAGFIPFFVGMIYYLSGKWKK